MERPLDPLRRRLFLLFTLCLAEYLPISLLNTTLPVLMRRGGASLEEIGLLSAAFFPWALKFLWAPLVDRFGSRRIGRYRSWLMVLLPAVATFVVCLAFLDLPALLAGDRGLGLALLLLLTMLCATLDTAAHGLAVVLLPAHERGFGNGVQTAGQMAGNLIGGGVSVALVGVVGWRAACLAMAALYLVPWLAMLRAREPAAPPAGALRARDFARVVRLPGMARWWAWLAVFGVAYGLFGIPYQAALVDAGLELPEIGLVQGVVMSLAGAAGALAGGLSMRGFERGRAFLVACLGFSLLLAPGAVAFSVTTAGRAPLYASLACAYFGVMLVSTVLYAMMMDRSRPETASSDFTAQYSVLQISGFVSWGAGAFLAAHIGSAATIALSSALVLGLGALGAALSLAAPPMRRR
jgi:hypothetical protein